MKITKNIRLLSLALSLVLVAATVLSFTACKDNKIPAPNPDSAITAVGEGDTTFTFTVTDIDGNTESFEVSTNAETVGEALIENGLVTGEDGPYGLYVKVVNGITADYDKDGTYWAFYIDGEYAMTGVDKTPVEDGKVYSFKVEK